MVTATRRRVYYPDPVSPGITSCYTDGCEVSESCLTCPLAVCRFEDPDYQANKRWAERRGRAQKLASLVNERRWPVPMAAGKLGIGSRTAYRWLKQLSREAA